MREVISWLIGVPFTLWAAFMIASVFEQVIVVVCIALAILGLFFGSGWAAFTGFSIALGVLAFVILDTNK